MIRLARFLKPYKFLVALILGLVLLQALANLYLPTLFADIVNTGIVKGDVSYIISIGVIMLLITLGGALCAIVANFFSSRVATGFGRTVRAELFTRVQSYSLHEFSTVSTASLITRTTNDTTQVQQVLVFILSMMISAPVMAIGGIFLAVSQDANLAWTLVIIVPLVAIIFFLVMGKSIPLFRSMQGKIDRLNLVLDEGLTGVRVIRAFDRMEHEKERFDQANLDLTNTAIKVFRLVSLMMPAMMLVMNISTIVIIAYGSFLVNNGSTQIGSMMAFMQYAIQILFSVMMVTMMFVMLPRAAVSADRINEVLDLVPEINDPENAQIADKQRGYIEFRDVTFSYVGAEEPALSNISFSARPGQTTAIIGGTGSGKSTLIGLIPRFYDVSSGSVLVDGVDVRDMAQEHLRGKIGFVSQKAVLFSGTVAENIRFGKKDASDEEVKRAAEIAQASDFIEEMKDGFNSVISQGGTNVSGGQKQRLAIARALVRKPEIYVFDDSFSALDFTTDARLRLALKDETQDATVLIVAQRVGTVMTADQIIVLDEGRIAGIGTHSELMETSEVYREIVSSQLSMEEIA